jgi:dTDP-4-dehydrorhamnose reductase
MHLLVFGTIGQLGIELQRQAGNGVTVRGVSQTEADFTDPATIRRAILDNPADLVVNAAAYTAVDRAETDADLAFLVNRDGPAAMAEACAAAGRPLVQISTDYVFDGSKAGAYTEDDPVHPLGVYGVSKEEGEQAVRTALPRHLILRTSWVFSAHSTNFVKTMLRFGAERPELRVVADQHGCPTAAADLAAAIVAAGRRLSASGGDLPWGTYHYSGAGPTTWHGFAEAIFAERQRLTGAPPPVLQAITTDEWPTPVRRPANSVLDCTRIQTRLGIVPADWRRSLAAVMAELLTTRKDT